MAQEVNQIVSFVFDDEDSFNASSGYLEGDRWKICYIKSIKEYKILVNPSTNLWEDFTFKPRDLLKGKYSPSIADGVISTYQSRVIAAGDTLTDKELDALRSTLPILVQSTVFRKLRELWVPMGTSALTGAMVKILADSTAGTSMTPNNLLAGDYTKTTGVTGNGTNKYINTGFNPTTAAVQSDGWGFGAFGLNTTGSGALAGTVTGFNSYLMYASLNDSRFNNIQISGTFQYPRFCAVQANVTEAQVYHGGSKFISVPYVSASVPNVNIGLLTANGGNYSSQSIVGWAAWGLPLTVQELKTLAEFFDSINILLGRQVFKPSISVCGDSNARGYVPGGGTAVTSRYSASLSTLLGMTDANSAVDDTTMSNDASSGVGNWTISRRATGSVAKAPAYLVCALGTNDARYNVSINNFLDDYNSWVAYQIYCGFIPENIILCTPIAATDAATNQTNLTEFVKIIKQIGGRYGCRVCDLYTATKGISGIFQTDNLHLNQAGHDLVYTELLKTMQSLP